MGKDNSDNTCISNKWKKKVLPHDLAERELSTSLVAKTSEQVFFVNFRIPDNGKLINLVLYFEE